MKDASTNLSTAPKELLESYERAIKSCSFRTCVDEAAPYYDLQQKLVRAWGSNVIAIMLFIGENWMRGRKDWFPIAVEKMQFEPGYRQYWMIFQPKHRILCDFTVDFFSGGTVHFDPDLQEERLQEVLADPTLENRLAIGMRNFGIRAPVKMILDLFAEALHEGQKLKPETLSFE